jgi:hypothetical protein
MISNAPFACNCLIIVHRMREENRMLLRSGAGIQCVEAACEDGGQ